MVPFWLAEDDGNKVVSAMVPIESRSAVQRLSKEGRLTSGEAAIAIGLIERMMQRIVEQPFGPATFKAANNVIDRHSLRALDAIQLGSAIVARDLLAAPDMRFIASDKTLLDAARAEGFVVWNPAV